MAGNQQAANTGRDDYLKDPDYFMAAAVLSAQRSKDPNTQVGACIVNQENEIIAMGYNRMPNGCDGTLSWNRDGDNELEKKYFYVCHAELNALINKSKPDVKGCTLYVTLFPCNECAKLVIQAGLKKVVYLSDKYHDDPKTEASRRMLKFAKIPFMRFESTLPMPTVNIDLSDRSSSDNPGGENV